MVRGKKPVPDRNLAFDLVRTTEAAALAAARWVGRGDKDRRRPGRRRRDAPDVQHGGARRASSSSARGRRTRRRCSTTASTSAPAARPPSTWPSTRSTARASSRGARPMPCRWSRSPRRGTMFDPGPCVYMEKVVSGPIGGKVDRHHRPDRGERAQRRQGARDGGPDLTVTILDRDRHQDVIARVRQIGRTGPADQRRRRRRRDRGGQGRDRRRPALRHRRHARGGDRRGGA